MAIRYLQPVIQALNAGVALPGATLTFYEAGTLVPADTYTTAAASVPNANPVVADENGLFPPIYLAPEQVYDVLLKDDDGATIDTVEDLSIGPAAATQEQVDAGSGSGYVTATTLGNAPASLINSILGYTPANVAGDSFTGPVRFNYTATSLTSDAAGFRGAPATTHDATYTLVMDDSGRAMIHTSGSAHTWTIPPNASVAYPLGTTIALMNAGSGAVNLARGAGVSLRSAGSATDSDKSLAQHGLATIFLAAFNSWYITGSGVS